MQPHSFPPFIHRSVNPANGGGSKSPKNEFQLGAKSI
jgi:hypothetical protein